MCAFSYLFLFLLERTILRSRWLVGAVGPIWTGVEVCAVSTEERLATSSVGHVAVVRVACFLGVLSCSYWHCRPRDRSVCTVLNSLIDNVVITLTILGRTKPDLNTHSLVLNLPELFNYL